MNSIGHQFAKPVDPELFFWCYGIYNSSPKLNMTTNTSANNPIFQVGDEMYDFADSGVNIAMRAVINELGNLNTSKEDRESTLFRVMSLGMAAQEKPSSQIFEADGKPKTIVVSEALIKACATAKLLVEEDRMTLVTSAT